MLCPNCHTDQLPIIRSQKCYCITCDRELFHYPPPLSDYLAAVAALEPDMERVRRVQQQYRGTKLEVASQVFAFLVWMPRRYEKMLKQM